MQVNLYNETDTQPYASNIDLAECFPDDYEELAYTAQELSLYGSCCIGGGAAPLIRIERAA